jgi:hypothetical protein
MRTLSCIHNKANLEGFQVQAWQALQAEGNLHAQTVSPT